MQVVTSSVFPEVKIFVPSKFIDRRGMYIQTYDVIEHTKEGCPPVFIQDCIAKSQENVLRGIHGDNKTWKLIQCLQGCFCLVIVDNRKDSPTYLQHEKMFLSGPDWGNGDSYFQVLVPPGFGNGHYILSNTALFQYKQSTSYDRESQFTLRWDDPALKIDWHLEGKFPILSERDATASFIQL